MTRRRAIPAYVAALVLSTSATDAAAQRALDAARYAKCMEEARTSPATALTRANKWHAAGGGTPAGHCQATALIGLGQYTEGAARLEKLAESAEAVRPGLAVDLLAQAGRTWLIAGNAARAITAQTRALEIRPGTVDLLIDRSISRVSDGKVWQAIDDLNAAVDADPKRVDALVFRAAAWRRLDSLDLAEEDVRRALALQPANPDALIERGHLHLRRGRRDEARADWLAVLRANSQGPAAETARSLIEQLDVRKD